MATTSAILISEPRRTAGVRTVRVKLAPDGYEATARIMGSHDWYPYKEGDRVRVQVLRGDTKAGVQVTAPYGSPTPKSAGNRELHARDGDFRTYAPNGDNRVEGATVRLGEGPDEEQKPVAVGEQIDVDTESLQVQLDQFLNWFLTVYDGSALAPFTLEMQKVVQGWAPSGSQVGAHTRAPDARHARNTVARPEDETP